MQRSLLYTEQVPFMRNYSIFFWSLKLIHILLLFCILGPYRYNNSTFSPMALNNLNNPYSPQPSTPNATGEVIMMDLPQVNVAGNNKCIQISTYAII